MRTPVSVPIVHHVYNIGNEFEREARYMIIASQTLPIKLIKIQVLSKEVLVRTSMVRPLFMAWAPSMLTLPF